VGLLGCGGSRAYLEGGGEEADRALSIKQVGSLGIAKDKYGRLSIDEEQKSSLGPIDRELGLSRGGVVDVLCLAGSPFP
jgi:hypothetical protein